MRIVIIDDSEDAIRLIKSKLGEGAATYLPITYTVLDEDICRKIAAFNPDLLLTDLVLENDREEGIRLVREIHKNPVLSRIPLVIISKLINDSPLGEKLRLECLQFPGVDGAFGKLHLPTLADLKQLVTQRHQHE